MWSLWNVSHFLQALFQTCVPAHNYHEETRVERDIFLIHISQSQVSAAIFRQGDLILCEKSDVNDEDIIKNGPLLLKSQSSSYQSGRWSPRPRCQRYSAWRRRVKRIPHAITGKHEANAGQDTKTGPEETPRSASNVKMMWARLSGECLNIRGRGRYGMKKLALVLHFHFLCSLESGFAAEAARKPSLYNNLQSSASFIPESSPAVACLASSV